MTINDIESALKKASDALDCGDTEAAVALYEGILKQEPDNHEACLMLGSLYGEAGRLPEAIELLQKAAGSRPDDAAASLVLARIYRATGKPDEAIRVLEKAGEGSEDAEIDYTLATLEEEAGNRGRAQELLERATGREPENVDAWLAMASFWMNAGEFAEAESAYRRALELEPSNTTAVSFLSVALSQQERAEEAETLLRAALQDGADDSELHYCLAHTLRQQGMHTGALESCDRALAMQPGERRFIIKKAEILEGMGDLDQAFDLLKPILTSGDIPVDAALIFARLSHPLGMVDDGKLILQKFSEQPLTPLHRQSVSEALQWLESV